MKRDLKKAIIVLIILFFPGILLLFLLSGEGHIKKLPYYGPKKPYIKLVDGKKEVDTTYFTIPNFKLADQNGDTITRDSMFGHVYVVEFFFATCPTICPKMAVMIKELQAKMIKNDNFRILSITIDPMHDSIPVLKAYAKKVHAAAGWDFLTGPQKEIYYIGQHGFFLPVREDKLAPGGYLHSGQLTLVDKKGHIRGYFDGTSLSSINHLEDAIKALYYGEHVPWKGKKKQNVITQGK